MPLELSPEEREHIRAEEIFRAEVRRDLEEQRKPKRLRASMWNFVNTSFGIWLLSSVGLASIVWGWTLSQESRQAEKADKERFARVNYEVYRDFWAFYGLIENSWNYDQYTEAHRKTLERPEYILSDFKDNTMEQLLWIMGQLPPSDNRARAEKLLRIVEAFRNDIGTLKDYGNLSPAAKKEFDDRIRKTLKEQAGPLLYPTQPDAFIFAKNE
jgi:hypothetical protein